MPAMETVKELLKEYRRAVCAFHENPTDSAIRKIERIQAKLIKLGHPVEGL